VVQSMHTVLSTVGKYFPLPQAVQTRSAVDVHAVLRYIPAPHVVGEQSVHVVLPTVDEYFPFTQGVHARLPVDVHAVFSYDPATQAAAQVEQVVCVDCVHTADE
jgi:hypothetical protein